MMIIDHMNKILCVLLVLVVQNVLALSKVTINNVVWPYEQIPRDDGYVIEIVFDGRYVNSFSGDIVVPAEINGLPVVGLQKNVFLRNNNVTSVYIPASVEYIGPSVFDGCEKLVKVELNEGLRSIGSQAFNNCVRLNDISLPKSLMEIGANAFRGCSALSSMELPDTLTYVGNYAFKGCSGLAKDGFVIINGRLFDYSGSSRDVVMPNNVSKIEGYAFANNLNIRSVRISDSVIAIGVGAFQYCTSLSSLSFSSGLQSIEEEAFLGCESLTSVSIPCGVNGIGNRAFTGCSKLKDIVISKDNERYENIDNVLYDKRDNIAMWASPINKAVSIRAGTVEIAQSAFYNSQLQSVQLPTSLKTIGVGAFWGCASLSSVEIPKGVTSIGADAFYECNSLLELEVPCNVKTIGTSSFSRCSSLKSVKLNLGVETIGNNAFAFCSSLISVEIPSSVTIIGEWAFDACDVFDIVYVEVGDKDRIMGMMQDSHASGHIDWIEFIESIKYSHIIYEKTNGAAHSNPDTYKEGTTIIFSEPAAVEGYEFVGWEPAAITPDKMGDVTVTAVWKQKSPFVISNGVLYDYEGEVPRELIIPDTVTEIVHSEMFKECDIDVVIIPASVTKIWERAFPAESKNYPETIEAWGVKHFVVDEDNPRYRVENGMLYDFVDKMVIAAELGVSGKIELPSDCIAVGGSAFKAKHLITEVVFPDSLARLGYKAFSECSGLTKLDFSKTSLAFVGEKCFKDSLNITNFSFPKTLENIDSNAFVSDAEEFGETTALSTVYVENGDSARVKELMRGKGVDVEALAFVESALKTQFEGGLYRIEDSPQDCEDPHGDEKYIEHMYSEADYAGYWQENYVEVDGQKEPAAFRDNRRFGFAIPVLVAPGESITPEIVHLTSNATYFHPLRVLTDEDFRKWERHYDCNIPAANPNRYWVIVLHNEIPNVQPNSKKEYRFDLTKMNAANGRDMMEWTHEHGEEFPDSISLPESVSYQIRIKETDEVFPKRLWNVYNPMYDELYDVFGGDDYDYEQEGGDYLECPGLWLVTKEMLDVAGFDPEVPEIVVSDVNGTITLPEGMTVDKVLIKIVVEGHDIRPYINLPVAVGGVIDLSAAVVKPEVAAEAMDITKGAEISLSATNPTITTAPTKPGLTYTLVEGTTIESMGAGASKLGDGTAWTPEIKVKGGVSAFYSIKVTK